METLMVNPEAFGSYAVCAAILGLKMFFSAIYTGSRRQAHQAYINPEDAKTFGQADTQSVALEGPEVAHALRIERNDLANIPLFLAIGLIYVLSGASAFGATAYCWTFTIARIAHTICYMNGLQPWRSVAFGIGLFATLGMIVQIIFGLV